ncbi:MAG: hypothetical protein LBJ67_09460 [Planctomycetaceae bacterium]|nr:hypothetical protein [Planctomycetaceae bacterium]
MGRNSENYSKEIQRQLGLEPAVASYGIFLSGMSFAKITLLETVVVG